MQPSNLPADAYARPLSGEHGLRISTDFSTVAREELMARILDLEKRVRSLQDIVCYLLQKNESLRVRIGTACQEDGQIET